MLKMRSARAFLLLLVFLIVLNFMPACSAKKTKPADAAGTDPTSQTVQSTASEEVPQEPLLVGYPAFSGQFSQFYADTSSDNDVIELTAVRLLTTDRAGRIVYKAIAGQTIGYAGLDYLYTGIADLSVTYDESTDQTSYNWKIRDDVYFSNGQLLTADDVIFSYYVYCDPDYDGPGQLNSLPIVGLVDYRTQTTAEVYQKYASLFNTIYAAGADRTRQDDDEWNEKQQDSVWQLIETGWRQHIQSVVEYSKQELLGLAELLTGYAAEDILAEEGLQVMAAMVLWEVADINEEGLLASRSSTQKWNLAAGAYPTEADFYTESYLLYEGNPEAYFYESRLDEDQTPLLAAAQAEFVALWGPADETMAAEGIPDISGIKKISAREVEIKLEGYDAAAIYTLGIHVAPLSYYGDLAKYDYGRNMFGFPYGDLSQVRAKTAEPVGAGPYKFVKYENKTVYLTANQHYYKGEPVTSAIQLRETAVRAAALTDGRIDIFAAGFDQELADEVRELNGNGQLDGDKIISKTVDDLSYRYIGINAKKVNVAGQAGSEASKNLRRGLATVLAAYRELAAESFYGELASVLEYPISASSWAAPQPADRDYQAAFSQNLAGASIYSPDMDPAERYAAASQAALEYFVAAGYTLDESGSKLLAAPEGAKLTYEILIPGNGQGDHPAYRLALEAKANLARLGIELVINDPTDINELWDALDSGSHELWSAGWKASVEPDLFQIYHSSNVVGPAGSSAANSYNIADDELDNLIEQARASTDQNQRQKLYRRSLDIILDWAVELPFVQQKSAVIFNREKFALDTVPAVITPYWSWLREIELLRLN